LLKAVDCQSALSSLWFADVDILVLVMIPRWVMAMICVFQLQKKFIVVICIIVVLAILALIIGLSVGLKYS